MRISTLPAFFLAFFDTPAISQVVPHIGILNASTLDRTGTIDVTEALQGYINEAFNQNVALFLPPGRYLVSDTLHVIQRGYFHGDDGGINVVPTRFTPHVIIGSIDSLPARPTIVLAERSHGFDNASAPKNVMKITNPVEENVNMNNMIRGVDFEVLPGNPGAVALFFHGAQGATVQDVSIRLAPDSFAGFGGAAGAGGSHMNVQVIGGHHGMWIPASEPSPLVAGAQFLDQSSSAIVFSGQPPLVLVGVKIRQSPHNIAPAVNGADNLPISAIDVVVECGSAQTSVFKSSASIHLENVFVKGCNKLIERPTAHHLFLAECDAQDPSQRWIGGGLAPALRTAKHILNPQSQQCIGLKDTHDTQPEACDSAAEFAYNHITHQLHVLPLDSNHCVDVSQGTGPSIDFYPCHNKSDYNFPHQELQYDVQNQLIISSSASTPEHSMCIAIRASPGRLHHDVPLESHGDAYVQIQRFVEGVDMTQDLKMDVIYKQGERYPQGTMLSSTSTAFAPPDITARHVPWEEASFPSFEASATANAVTLCGAAGNGKADDHRALQNCLDKFKDVFLPKGRYRLSCTLKLNSGNRLVGLSPTHSVLMPISTGFCPSSAGSHSPPPLVSTAPGSDATIAFVGLTTWWHLPIFTLQWQSSGGLYRNNYDTRVCECLWLANYRSQTIDPPCKPAINLTVAKAQISGTGAFINFVNDVDILMTDHEHYRHVLVFNNSRPSDIHNRLRFYELNMEHAMSEANMELNNAHHVDVFGFKLEGSNVALWMRDSSDIYVVGLGPAGDAFPNRSYLPRDFAGYPPSIVRLERSSNFSFYNLVDTGRGGMCSRPDCNPSPITPWPLTPQVLATYNWTKSDQKAIIQSEWAPWPGYYVDPRTWNLLVEADGPGQIKLQMAPLDRPVAYIDESHSPSLFGKAVVV